MMTADQAASIHARERYLLQLRRHEAMLADDLRRNRFDYTLAGIITHLVIAIKAEALPPIAEGV